MLTAEIITLRWNGEGVPAYSPHSRWDVGDDSPEETIRAFLNATVLLNKEASQAATADGCPKWVEAKQERQRVIRQVRSQIPITKSMFGNGAGEELRRIALVKPQQRAKNAKRNSNALSREDAIDGFWVKLSSVGSRVRSV